MKRVIFLILMGVMILSAVSAKDIGYILKNSGSPDTAVTSAITELGYTYDFIDDSALPSTNFSQYKIIIVGDGNYGSMLQYIPVNEKKSLILNTNHMDDWHWNYDGISHISSSQPIKADVVYNLSKITEGIPQKFQVYTQAKSSNGISLNMYYLPKSKRAIKIKNIVGTEADNQDSAIAIVYKGMVLKNGYVAKARGLFFGITESDYWTSYSKQLFKNSIVWLIDGEDIDKDGYNVDEDCNDNDPTIHPNAIEISYDHIDQNCDGYDLADVDKDGYCLIGYAIENKTLQCSKENGTIGTDCNDNDRFMNPGSPDPRKDCKNAAPVLIRPIPIIEWDEDKNVTKNLDIYFSDPDEDNLQYSVNQTSSNQDIKIVFLGNGLARFESTQYWHGEDWVIFKAEDPQGLYVLSNNVTLKVNHVNHAPIIEPIDAVYGVERQKIEIAINASDVEGDSLTYSINDERFENDGNVFRWQTEKGDEGEYAFEISVSDGQGGISTQEFSLYIFKKIYINEFVTNPSKGNQWVELYNPGARTFILNSCYLTSSAGYKLNLSGEIEGTWFRVLEYEEDILNPDGDFIELYCFGTLIDKVIYGNYNDGNLEDNAPSHSQNQSTGRDPDGQDTGNQSKDFRIFDLPTKGLPSNADMVVPKVGLISPVNGSFFNDTRDINFEFYTEDNKATKLECTISINEIPKATNSIENGTNGIILVEGISDGNHVWNVECSDGINKKKSDELWNFRINAPDNPIIDVITDKEVNENQLLEFIIHATDADGGHLTLRMENAPEGATFNDNEDETGKFSWTPSYNQAGVYNVRFIAEDETGLTGLRTAKITVKDVKMPPQFSDAPQCKVKNPNIELSITKPKKGADFKIGDKINNEVKIKNGFEEDLNFNIETHLYDIDNEESLDSTEDDINIDSRDSETIKSEIEIPDDAEDNDLAIYVYVEDEEGRCNSGYVNIEIKREKDDVIINNINLNSETIYPGENLDVSVEVENIGKNDQDVYIKVEVPDLNISGKTGEFQLEKYGDDDTEEKTFYLDIPKDAEEGVYELTATVYFSSKEDSKTESFTVMKKSAAPIINPQAITQPETSLISQPIIYTPIKLVGKEPVKTTPIIIEEKKEIKPTNVIIKEKEENKQPVFSKPNMEKEENNGFDGFLFILITSNFLLLLDILIIGGIIIELILIVIVFRY